MRTMIERPLRLLVTRTLEPNGRDLCAAVLALWRRRSPLAVVLVGPAYHEALPHCLKAWAGPLTISAAKTSAQKIPVLFKNMIELQLKY